MTLIFIMILEVTAQGSRHKDVCAWTFLQIFLHFFLFFSLCLSHFLRIFLSMHIYLRCLFWPCFFTESSRVFEKKNKKKQKKKNKVKVDFQNSIFLFFRHFKASSVLQVRVKGLMLRAYKVMVMAHTKIST